nr:hypothetical protein [Tanacetum cinerariifolium]
MGQDKQMQMVGGNANQNLNRNGNLVATHADGNANGHNGNLIRCYNCKGLGLFTRNCTIRPRRRDAAYLQTQLLIAQKEEAGIQLQAEEFDLMAVIADLDEIEEVNANCILMANLQQASTSDGSAEVHNYENCYDDEIFNMFTQEEQYTELLEPIPEPHQVPQNDNNVIFEDTSMEQSGGTVEQHPVNVEETRVLYDSLYNNLAIEVEKVNTVNLPNEESSDDTKPSVARKFLNEANVSKNETQQKNQPEIKKPKNVGTHKSLATPKPRKPIFLLRWSPTGRLFDHDGKLVAPSNSESHVDCSNGGNAYTLNPLSQKLENENMELEFQVSDQKDTNRGMSANTKFAKQSILGKPPKVGEILALSKPVTSNSIPTPQESKVMQNDKVIALGMFRINPFKPSREEKYVPNNVRASVRTKSITVSQPPVITKKVQYLISVNHDVCLLNYVNGMSSRGKKQTTNVSIKEKQKKQKPKVKKPKKVGSIKRLSTPKPSKPRSFLRWLPTGRLFDLKGKIIASSESESQSDCSKGDNACTSNPMEPTIKRFPNSTFSLADHVAAILGFGDLQWGNILITRVYKVEGLGHNLFFVGQFYDSDLEYHKEHLCPSCEQGKSKRASHPPKPVPNSRQMLHLLHMDLCGPMRIASINGKLTDNDTEFKNQVLKEYFDSVGISHQMSSVRTPQQNGVVERRNQTLVEAARTMLIFSRAPLFLWAEVIATAIFTRRSKKIMETMIVSFDELSAMDFEQRSSKPRLQSMTSGQISLGLDLTYAPSTITTQQPTEGELDLLFEAMYDDYIGGQPSTAARTVLAPQAPQVCQTSTTSTTIADTASTPTDSSSRATNFLNTSHDVYELNSQPQHDQQQGNQAPIQPKTVADNVPNDMFDANMFVNPFAASSTSVAESSSSHYVDPSNMHTFY